MPAKITINVNGTEREVALDYEDTPLLYVLRDDLGLKGTRFGCGDAQCGACTVLIDGRAERSCEVAAATLVNKSVTTVEGLGTAEHLHPVQKAVLDHQAGQCGYCLSGIIMKSAELFERGGAHSRQELKDHLDGNLCRCGAHGRIVDALTDALRAKRGGGS
jgi:aerobic-type carbon monoxide dehydrogenase small subunit (CoxS/CutS family)